ncbi:MAG TPA: hypothetical protein VLM91_27060, partial [Candidatus Methylomirabilis sp.]|nr:hypothetical protein [Candidatus Methylomirabilis sp.]
AIPGLLLSLALWRCGLPSSDHLCGSLPQGEPRPTLWRGLTFPVLLLFALVVFSAVFAFTHFAMSTMSNTFIASHTPTSLGGTAFGISFTLSIGVGSLASSSMGLIGEHFGLSAIFLALGMTAALAVGLVVWFGSTVGAWSPRAAPSTAPLLPTSHPRGR